MHDSFLFWRGVLHSYFSLRNKRGTQSRCVSRKGSNVEINCQGLKQLEVHATPRADLSELFPFTEPLPRTAIASEATIRGMVGVKNMQWKCVVLTFKSSGALVAGERLQSHCKRTPPLHASQNKTPKGQEVASIFSTLLSP